VKRGLWAGCDFEFRFMFTSQYPEVGPTITCVHQVWHPNIDMDGKPCVNVIRMDWSPSYGIELLFNGLLYVIKEGNRQINLLNIYSLNFTLSSLDISFWIQQIPLSRTESKRWIESRGFV